MITKIVKCDNKLIIGEWFRNIIFRAYSHRFATETRVRYVSPREIIYKAVSVTIVTESFPFSTVVVTTEPTSELCTVHYVPDLQCTLPVLSILANNIWNRISLYECRKKLNNITDNVRRLWLANETRRRCANYNIVPRILLININKKNK